MPPQSLGQEVLAGLADEPSPLLVAVLFLLLERPEPVDSLAELWRETLRGGAVGDGGSSCSEGEAASEGRAVRVSSAARAAACSARS